MFNRQMEEYTLELPQTSTNEWNETLTSFTFDRNIKMAICMISRNNYNANIQVF